MSRIAYVNGQFVPFDRACVHIEDRGLQFSDGVYEVWSVRSGKLFDLDAHFGRLARSLNELRIKAPIGFSALKIVLHEIIRRNRITDGIVYLQINRGVSRRDHAFPNPEVEPSLIITARIQNIRALDASAAIGARVITVPESRWARCDIKSVSLLPNILAKQAAKEAGAHEAWFVDNAGLITEGSSTNAWIVDSEGVIKTRDLGANILHGVTRAHIMKIAQEHQLQIDEVPFTLEDVYAAREAFYTAATAIVTPVVSINAKRIGDGAPGPIAAKLRALYLQGA